MYSLQRDPRSFSPLPDTFWPDRWLPSSRSQPHHSAKLASSAADKPRIHNTAAFMPFSQGHANCAGKNLALAEMRVVLALLMQRL